MYVGTMQRLQRTRIQNKQIAITYFDTPETLKQCKGHQTYNGNVDRNQGYNHAKSERSGFNGVLEKSNVTGFFVVVVVVFRLVNKSVISFEHVPKK